MRTLPLLLVLAAPALAAGLMPMPASVTSRPGALAIDGSFAAEVSCADGRIEAAAGRLVRRLAAKTGVAIPTTRTAAAPRPALRIGCASSGDQDESYRLEVTPEGAALTAPQSIGALRGMETFLQMAAAGPDGFAVPAAVIADGPRFPWRGLLIDSARHFLPLEVIYRNIDGMAAVKFNVLHWHLSDDQGFRVESKRFPKLHQLGSDGLFYTRQEIRDVIDYAYHRGIRVVPEFEMPGHATAILAAYPELAAAPGPYRIERFWGIFDPIMDPTREELYTFLEGFLGEMSGLFRDPYLHIGGDEVNGKQWTANGAIQAFMRQRGFNTNHDLQAYFNQRVQRILAKHGKRMMGWDEIFHPALPKDIVIQSWRGQDSLAETARQGYQGILSFGCYLDHMQTAAFHYGVDPLAGKAAGLGTEEKSRILGGEACMWGEYVSAETVDSRIWPRAAAIAERLWSPESVTGVDAMYTRMDKLSRELEWLGLKHRSNYRPMLERMAPAGAVRALETLVDALEPARLYARSAARRYTSATPLNRVVDAARPESEVARRYLSEPRQAREWLAELRDQYAELRPVMASSFLLREIEPLSADAAALGRAGLEASEYLLNGRRPPRAWISQANALLERAAKPRAEVSLAIVPVLRKLIESAAGDGDAQQEPQPRVVDPGGSGKPPADAVVLFDGSDLSKWQTRDGGPARCTVADGAMTCRTGVGDLVSKATFRDAQIHLEFAPPHMPANKDQSKGNSGVYLHGRYEIQILDSYQNPTYPTGSAAAVYGQAAPLVNASRPPGEWQTYDIVFRGARCDPAGNLLRKPRVTVVHNGVLVQDNVEIQNVGKGCEAGVGEPGPLMLQDHNYKGAPTTLMKFRNIWFRPLD